MRVSFFAPKHKTVTNAQNTPLFFVQYFYINLLTIHSLGGIMYL